MLCREEERSIHEGFIVLHLKRQPGMEAEKGQGFMGFSRGGNPNY